MPVSQHAAERQRRLELAKAKVNELVDRGVAFNPASASPHLLERALRNTERTGSNSLSQSESGASAQIQARTPGSATAPSGGPVRFKGDVKVR